MATLRLRYASGNIAENVLQEDEKDVALSVSRHFQEAIDLAQHVQNTERDRGPLQATLQNMSSMNIKEFRMLLRICAPLRPSAHQDLITFALVVMRYLVSHRMQELHPRPAQALVRVWDDATSALYALSQRAEENAPAFGPSLVPVQT